MAPGDLGTLPSCPVCRAVPTSPLGSPSLRLHSGDPPCSWSPTLTTSSCCQAFEPYSLSASPWVPFKAAPACTPQRLTRYPGECRFSGEQEGAPRAPTAKATLSQCVSGVKGTGGLAQPLTCSLEAGRDSISWRQSPGWNCMMSASSCLVLQGGSDRGQLRDRGGPGPGLPES